MLSKDSQKHKEPVEQDPVGVRDAGSGHLVEGRQGGLAAGYGVAPELDLGEHLDDASDDDQPQEIEMRFRSRSGGGDQFAGTHDRTRQDHSGSDVTQDAQGGGGGFANLGVSICWFVAHAFGVKLVYRQSSAHFAVS